MATESFGNTGEEVIVSAEEEFFRKPAILIGELDTVQLPGLRWTAFPIAKIWSWGGIDEKVSDSESNIAAACSPSEINWKTLSDIVAAMPFERGYIGALKIFHGEVWYGGWKKLEDVAKDPDAVLSIMKRIFDGAKTRSAVDFAKTQTSNLGEGVANNS